MERGRDRRYDDGDRGQTYRPSDRNERSPPPRANIYRANRSPPRRARTPPLTTDTYAPGGGRGAERPRSRSPRRRSRSPLLRGREPMGNFRGRPRSPPRAYSPRRDERMRSPPPRVRRYSRSPMGLGQARSPAPLKRVREPSPIEDRRLRSPPPIKRERYISPVRERYDRRGNSPPRDTAPRFPRENNYRPAQRERSRSPARRPDFPTRIDTPTSSRRSSPPIHPDRMAMTGSGDHSPAYVNARAPPIPVSPPVRDRTSPRRPYSPGPRSPPRGSLTHRHRSPPPRRHNSPPPRDRDDRRNGTTSNTWSRPQGPIASGPNYHNGDSRAPPNGPGAPQYNGSYARENPSGPPSAPISMSAHNRPSSATLLTAPTRPRGSPFVNREVPRDYPHGGPPPPRRGGPPPQSQYHGPPSRHPSNYDSRSQESVPVGPRGSNSNSGPPPFESRPPFRPNNSSSTTYPRTQRFSQHLGSVPAIVPGGKLLPSGLDPQAEKRLAQLEEDKKKLLEAIEEKQRVKREGLREWERSEREGRREGLKSELAEGHLERLTGGGEIGSQAF